MKSRPFKRSTKYLNVFVVAIMLTIAGGWLLTAFLGRVAEKEFKEKVDREANVLAVSVHDSLDDVENAAKALSQSEQLVAVLSSGSSVDLERASRLLDHVNSSLEMSVCYLLDGNGLTVASSNRNEVNGFVGKSFAIRPFVKGALAGRLTQYFALGIITHERGYFAAAPIVDSKGSIIGVIAIKRNVAPLGQFFRKYTHASLVSPEGIVFVSSREDLLYRSLWPVTKRGRSELQRSKQFGKINFEPLLAAEPRNGTYIRYDDIEYYIHRQPVGLDGWTLVTMDRPSIVANYRLFGILLTIVFGLLLLFFYVVLRNKAEALGAARNLLKSKDDWKRTFDTVPDLIAIIDSNHRIIDMNRAMADRLDLSRKEAVGRSCYELLHGSQEPPVSCPHRRMLDSGKTESEPLFNKALNGDFIVTVAPLLAEDGTIESCIHVMHDVSELKLLERLQKEYAQRLEFVLEGSNVATWEWDMVTNQGVLNTSYYELTEYAPGEVNTDFAFFISTIHPDDVSEVQGLLQEHLDGKTNGYEAQYRMVTKTGKLRNIMAKGKIVRYDEDGRPAIMAGVITDVTEMKKLSDEVNRIHNLESIGLLAGGLSHDFNNLLGIIYGNITFVKMLAGSNLAFVEPLTDAEEACERAKELGIHLQAFSQDSLPIKEPIAISALVEYAAEELFAGSNILHSISTADDLYPVEADPNQIRRVFDKLLTNSKEAMSDGGTVKIEIQNYVDGGKKDIPIGTGRYISITLQDEGKGIPEEHIHKIFDPYFSTKNTYSKRGMGLGLSMCYSVLKRHGGHISVESTLGIGTRVTVYLPACVEETTLSSEGRPSHGKRDL